MATSRLRRTVTLALLSATASVAVPAVASAAPTQPAPSAVPARAGGSTAALASQAVAELGSAILGQREVDPSYQTLRDEIATRVATELGIDPARMVEAWSGADAEHQLALLAALSQLGVPYRRNASKPGIGFDCSGLTTYAWGRAGRQLTRQSGAQIRAAQSRSNATAQAGDLAYYPGHVMMYLGVDEAMVHSPYTGRTVEVTHAPRKRQLRYGDPTE